MYDCFCTHKISFVIVSMVSIMIMMLMKNKLMVACAWRDMSVPRYKR